MQPQYYIRYFRMSDLDSLLTGEHARFGTEAYDRNLFAALSTASANLFLVAAAGARVRGYMVSSTTVRGGMPRAELVSVAVSPGCRGQGIASALMRSTLRRLRFRRVKRFSLAVRRSNLRAQTLYRKFAFTQVRRVRRYYEDGEDALILRKLL